MTQPPALADPALPFDGALGAALPLLASRVGAGLAETLQARPNRRDLPHSSAALLDRCQATDALPPALLRAAGRLAGARLLVVGGSASRGPLLDMAARLGLVTDPAGHVREAVRAVRLAIQSRRPYDTVLIGSEMRAADAVAGAEQLVRAAHGACPLALIAAPGARADLMPRLEASGLAIGALLLEPVTPARLVDACLRVSGMGSLGLVPDATGAPGNAGHAGNAPTPVAGRRVLLVDDNPIDAELVLHGLVDADVAAVWARDTWQALALLESDRFDAVLLDTRLPGPDGFETGRAIRARFDSNVLPVIALSADGLWSDRSRARAAGMNDDIRKPADPLQLIETLARWLAPRA